MIDHFLLVAGCLRSQCVLFCVHEAQTERASLNLRAPTMTMPMQKLARLAINRGSALCQSRHVWRALLTTSTEGEGSYRHPLSEIALGEIVRLEPPWLDVSTVVWDHSQGTFRLPIRIGEEEGEILTAYNSESSCHFMGVQFAKLVGRVNLTDNSKSAWQSNIGDDRERTLSLVKEMLEKIDEASSRRSE